MLLIRSEQMRALAEDADRRFLEDVIAAAALTHGAPAGLREQVTDAVDRAASYAIFDREDVEWFVDLDLKRGPAWETQPEMEWALEIVNNSRSQILGRRYRLEKQLEKWDSL